MSLSAGRDLSHYRLVEPIGEGGMGVVWKAFDSRLDRHIALKILPTELTADADRRRRFLREARAAAAVTHPNIVTIHEIDEVDGIIFIAMELVEGATLRSMVEDGPLPILEAVRIASEVAEGLDRAHREGIVHRDLKPDNIVLAADGHPRILDFGLAKLIEEREELLRSRVSRQETLSAHRTAEGTVLGTAAYMSPEQALGGAVDARSDIFSFGVTLYEMVTARRPFQGRNQIETLAAILHEPAPSASTFIPDLPARLEDVLGKCLEKDPGARYQTSKELLVDLRRLARDLASRAAASYQPAGSATGQGTRQAGPHPGHGLPRVRGVAFGAVLLLGAAAGLFYWRSRASPRPERIGAKFLQLTRQFGRETQPSLSPDGQWIAYVSNAGGNADIYLRAVGGENAINLTLDSTADDLEPAFSPDGARIAFRSEREGGGIFVMGRTGESPRRIAVDGFNPSWAPHGEQIVYSERPFKLRVFTGAASQLWVVNLADGERRKVLGGNGFEPHWSPHGHRIAFTASDAQGSAVFTISAAGREGEVAVPLAASPAIDWSPAWSADGSRVYFISDRGGSMNLWSAPVDEVTGRAMGDPEPLSVPSGSAQDPAVSADGSRIAFTSANQQSHIQRIDLDGALRVRGQPVWVTSGDLNLSAPDVTRDGAWIAYVDVKPGGSGIAILRTDGSSRRDVSSPAWNPSWSSDGRRIAFNSRRSGIMNLWRISRDGAGLEQLTDAKRDGATGYVHPVYAPDGSRIAFHSGEGGQGNAFLLELGAGLAGAPRPLPPLTTGGEYFDPWSWSPDGRWIAGNAIDAITRNDHHGIVVYSMADRSYRKLTDIGGQPSWLPDGRGIVFSSEGKLHLLNSATRETQLLFSAPPPEYVQWPKCVQSAVYFLRSVNEADLWMVELQEPPIR